MNAIAHLNMEEITKNITDMGKPWMDTTGLIAMQKKNMAMMAETAESLMAGASEMIEDQVDATKTGFEIISKDIDSASKIDSPQDFAQMQVEAAKTAFEFGFGTFQKLTATAMKIQAASSGSRLAVRMIVAPEWII